MGINSSKILISNQKIVQMLKKKKLLPSWVSDDFRLPPDPDKVLILVHKHPSNSISSVDLKRNRITQEKKMNYYDMALAVKAGCEARRQTWKPEEKVWSNGKILLHTTPYFASEYNEESLGYPYVTESEDITAHDWELIAV